MSSLIYILFSVFEGIVIFLYTMTTFRISIRNYLKEIGLTVLTISCATYFYTFSPILSNISVVLNLAATILALIFIFRISLIHSCFMGIFTFFTFFVFQKLYIEGIIISTSLQLNQILEVDWLRYAVQFSSDVVLLLITYTMFKKRIAFTFVPFNSSLRFRITPNNILFAVATIITFSVLSTYKEFDSILVGTIFWIVCFVIIIMIGVRREYVRQVD